MSTIMGSSWLPDLKTEPVFLRALRNEHYARLRAVNEPADARAALEKQFAQQDYAVRDGEARARRNGETFDESSVTVTPEAERGAQLASLSDQEAAALVKLADFGDRAVRELKAHRDELEQIARDGATANGGSPAFAASTQVSYVLRRLDSQALEFDIANVRASAQYLARVGSYA